MKNSFTSLFAGLLVVSAASSSIAADWPQWRGPNRDGKATGFEAPKTWPKELTQKWKVTVGTGDSTPALVGDRLYVSARQEGRELLLCLESASGKEIWREGYESQDSSGPSARHSGPRSSPIVAGGKVVTYGVRGVLSCYDADKGKLLWRKDDLQGTWPRFFTASSPVITEGLCVAQLGGEEKGGIFAYDMGSGDQKWKWTDDGTAYASPVAADIGGTPLIITLTAKKVVGLAVRDGKLLWEAPFAPQGRAYNAATPVVKGDTVIYSGSGRGTKAVKLEKSGEAFTAKELWSNPDNGPQFNSPVLKGGQVYGVSQNGDLFCIDAENGKTLWTSQLGGRGFASVVDAGSVLIGLVPQGDLTVFEPSDKQFQKVASYKVATTDVYAHPVVAGKGIYVKDQTSLAFWTLE